MIPRRGDRADAGGAVRMTPGRRDRADAGGAAGLTEWPQNGAPHTSS